MCTVGGDDEALLGATAPSYDLRVGTGRDATVATALIGALIIDKFVVEIFL